MHSHHHAQSARGISSFFFFLLMCPQYSKVNSIKQFWRSVLKSSMLNLHLNRSNSVSEHSNNKATSRAVVKRLSWGAPKPDAADSASPLPKPRVSADRSPRALPNSKPTTAPDRCSPKLSATPAQKQQERVSKGSEVLARLRVAQDDLKKTKEKLVLVEKEKAQVIEELKETQKLADEANEKLREAQAAQKRAEENSEIEKFRAIEMEQAAIESTQKKEEEWQKELDAVRSQHAVDVTAFLSITEELQLVKQELSANMDAKNRAINHADEVATIAKTHAHEVKTLTAELTQLKASLDSKLENEGSQSTKMVSELDLEIETLKQELKKMKGCEQKLEEKEACIKKLHIELEDSKKSESNAHKLMEEWQKKVKDLHSRAEESNRVKRSASQSLESVIKQLEGSNDLLHDAESEIATLKEKIGLLEISISRQRGDLEESERQLSMAKEKAAEMSKKAELLEYKLENVEEEKNQALNNEKLAAESVQRLLEEKNKLINELESSRDEEEKTKKAMESLAAALHEVSSQAREAKERLSSSQTEQELYESQIENLRVVLNATNEKYKAMIDDAKHEIDILTDTIEQNKQGYRNSRAEWEQKEIHMTKCVKKLEDENSSLGKEISRLANLLREAEGEVDATKEEGARLKNSLKEAESEVTYLTAIMGEAKAESMRLKESLLDKENELQSVTKEHEELLTREGAPVNKIKEVTGSPEEVTTQMQEVENHELPEDGKCYNMLPKVMELSVQNGDGREEEEKVKLPPEQCEQTAVENLEMDCDHVCVEDVTVDKYKVEIMNGNQNNHESKENNEENMEVDVKMWKVIKIREKETSPKREEAQMGLEDDMDQINGLTPTENADYSGTSPPNRYGKKKKPLLRKFGNLLKMKGANN